LTGTVSFYDYGIMVAGPFTVSNGQAQMGSGDLDTIGVHQFTARYNGDPRNLSSTSAGLSQTITGTTLVIITGSTGSDSHALSATVGIQ
jgi:hypothetical protein